MIFRQNNPYLATPSGNLSGPYTWPAGFYHNYPLMEGYGSLGAPPLSDVQKKVDAMVVGAKGRFKMNNQQAAIFRKMITDNLDCFFDEQGNYKTSTSPKCAEVKRKAMNAIGGEFKSFYEKQSKKPGMIDYDKGTVIKGGVKKSGGFLGIPGWLWIGGLLAGGGLWLYKKSQERRYYY